MEKALRYEIITNIPALANTVYPTNAPENRPLNTDGTPKPYLVYERISTDNPETLTSYTDKNIVGYMFSVIYPGKSNYGQMVSLRNQVVALLKYLSGRAIGQEHIETFRIHINNITETWESELEANRGIIDFTIYY